VSEGFDRSAVDFRRARLRSFLNALRGRVSRQPARLLAFGEVREKLHLGGPVFRGVQAVPLDKIVGSVDRYRDFDRMFLPTQSHTSERWRKISRARYQDISLPPVLLFKVGEVYFVVDGNHRVSVAREAGQEYIDAEVREVISRVPVTADVGADDLECLEERVQFLERTQLDRLHPEAVIKPTIVGGYDRLIEHIAVHCYFMGIDQGRSPSEEEAVNDWYDTLYRPVVEVVRETGVLDEFPGRTETDLYLWIMYHLHYLRSHEAEIGPAEAAADFIQLLDDD
jgi:hypothetical protein